MIHQWRFNMRKSWLNQSYFWFYHTHKIFHTSTLSPYYSGKFWNFLMKIEKHTWLTIGNTTVLKPSAIFISNLSFVTGYPPYIESPKKVCQMKNLKNKSLQRTWLTLLFVRKKKLLWQGAHDIFLSTCCIPRRCPDHMFKSTQRVPYLTFASKLLLLCLFTLCLYGIIILSGLDSVWFLITKLKTIIDWKIYTKVITR